MDIHTRKKAIEIAYTTSLGAKLYLPYAFCFILLVMVIFIYIEVFKNKENREPLFLAIEEQEMALEVNTGFINLLTYYPKTTNGFSGYFEIVTTTPASIKLKAINNENVDISTNVIISASREKPS